MNMTLKFKIVHSSRQHTFHLSMDKIMIHYISFEYKYINIEIYTILLFSKRNDIADNDMDWAEFETKQKLKKFTLILISTDFFFKCYSLKNWVKVTKYSIPKAIKKGFTH